MKAAVPAGPMTSLTRSQNGPLAWKRLFGQRRVLNMGFGWDRTQNVLWRLAHGEFDGLHPRYVVINIGTNNFSSTSHARANTPAEVAKGIRAICTCIRAKAPESRIILMGVFPRGAKPDDPFRAKILELNNLLAEVGKGPGITVLDIGQQFLLPNGELPRKLMSDFCHPTEDGYVIWASALAACASIENRPPRIKGRRRETRRLLAEKSRQLLEAYRAGRPVAEADCLLRRALTVAVE